MLEKQLLSVVTMFVFAMLVGGCDGDSAPEEATPPPAETAEAALKDLSTLRLAGTAWALESFGEPGDLVPSELDVRSTLNFMVDRYVGTGGCNFFLGVYDAAEDKLRMDSPARTRLGCEEPAGVMDQEATFIEAFLNATHYELEDDKLHIYTVENQRLMTMAPAERVPLQGTVWSLRFIFGDGEPQPLIPETTVTVSSDGEQLTGNAGCNDYSATLIREDGAVEIGELIVAEETCESPEYIMVQETDYLAALQSATSVEELASALILYNSDGAPVLLFGTQ